MNNLKKAKEILEQGNYTCVFYNGEKVYSSKKRGVAPLIEKLDSGIDFSGYSAADKVIGRGAAFLYIALGIKRIYVKIISQPSLELLNSNNVLVIYDHCVPAIRNRDNTGFCPIESTVEGIDDLETALLRIREKSAQLSSNNN